MDVVAQNNTMQFFKILLLSIGLVFALLIWVADWLYLARTRNSAQLIDMHPPAKIDVLIKSSMLLSAICVVAIIGVFMFGIH